MTEFIQEKCKELGLDYNSALEFLKKKYKTKPSRRQIELSLGKLSKELLKDDYKINGLEISSMIIDDPILHDDLSESDTVFVSPNDPIIDEDDEDDCEVARTVFIGKHPVTGEDIYQEIK